MTPQKNQSHCTVHTHITLSNSRIWIRIYTTTPENLQHGFITLVWWATKNYRQYISWIPDPPLQVLTPLFQEPHAHEKVGHHPQEVWNVWHPHMRIMHVRQFYSQTMTWTLQRDPTQALPNNLPWIDSLYGPASITKFRDGITDECHPHYQKISVCQSVCGSLLKIQLHASPSDRFIWRDRWRKIFIWKDGSRTGNHHQAITCSQWHDGNNIFRANVWFQDCQERANPQLTTYSGVDDRHTNGLAERRIRHIQDNYTT